MDQPVLLHGVKYGVNQVDAPMQADKRAVKEAIAISAFAGTTWPAGNEVFLKAAMEQLLDHVASFALHARRHLEITGTKGIQIVDSRWKFASGVENFALETDLWVVINKILHARNLQVVTWNRDSSLFTSLGDRVVTHLEIQSDRGDAFYVCPFGMVYAYLGRNPRLNPLAQREE